MVALRRWLLLAVGTAAVVAMVGSSALAQGRGRGGFGGRGGKLFLLENPEVRAELEIVDDQVKELEQLRDEMRTTFREMFSGIRDLPENERREAFGKVREKMQAAMQDFEKKLDDVLIPSQRERLNQLALQNRLRRAGTDGALGNEELAKELGITEEQKKKLAEVAEKVQKEMREKMAKLRKEAQDEVLQVLTPQQREKLEKMLGKQFEMPQRFGRGRGGPDRGPRN